MAVINGAQALIESLADEGVEVLFGIPGVQVMDVLDAIYQQEKIRWVTVRHEQTAAFMAFGYARTTGRIGAALVVPGPGALNATAAVGTAYAASAPVLVISGQIESYNQGKNQGVLHEVDDQLEVFRPLTKWCHRVSAVGDIPVAVREAVSHLKSGRPRPVELEIPWDLWQATAEVETVRSEPAPAGPPNSKQVKEAARLLAGARRPLIWAGGGVVGSDAARELTDLAEHLNAPVLMTDEGKGAVPGSHPLVLGNHNFASNPALEQADVILVVGSRFFISPRLVWNPQPGQKIVRIDIDPDEMARGWPVEVGIVADARITIAAVMDELPEATKSQWRADELEKIKAKVTAKLEEKAPIPMALVRILHDVLGDDGILIPGVTNLGYWCNLAYPVARPRNYLTSSYFATLGYAFPTALGAKTGNPERPVVALSGDGGFLYAAPELATAVQEGLNVVTVVMADGALGACLRIQQQRLDNRVLGTRLNNPDFVRLAESFGARGIKLSHHEELKDGLRSALAENGPVVIEVPVPTMNMPWETSLKP